MTTPTPTQGPYDPAIYTPGAVPPVEPIKVVAQILKSEMGLQDNQILLGLENFPIPETENLYIALFYGADQVIGNTNFNGQDSAGNFTEIQSCVMLHSIQIDIMSFNNEARTRKEEVLWAIQSYFATQLLEKYQMRLASTPSSFVPIRTLEPAKQLNRFSIDIMINAVHTNVKSTPYFDSLQDVKLVENP